MPGSAAHGRLEWAGTLLDIAPDGTARLGRSGPGISIRPPLVQVGPDGFSPIDWSPPRLGVVQGEAEAVRSAPGLGWMVRHHVWDSVWNVRSVLTAQPGMTLGAAELVVEAGGGTTWVWAAGSAALVILADDSQRPVAIRLRRGRLATPEAGRNPTGTYEWFDGGSDLSRPAVLELAGTRLASWAEAHSLLPAWLPQLALAAGDELRLVLPDDSVTGAGVESAGDGAFVVRGCGRLRVRVVGVSGDLALDVDLAPAFEGPLSLAAERIVTRITQGAVPGSGTEELAAALVVLVAAGRADTDAFDLICGALVERADHCSLRTVALAHAAVAAPEPALFAALAAAVAALRGPAARTVIKAVLRAALWSPEVTAKVLLAAPPNPAAAEGAASIAARLGGGLPGQPAPYDPVALARDAACLAGADEALDPDRWPYPAATIVEHTTRRLLAGEGDDERVLAWLLIGAAAGGQRP